MNRTDIISSVEALKAELVAFDVASLRLFGSHARYAANDKSDIDLVVAFRGPATFDNYMGLKLFLEDRLGRKIDLVTESAIRPELRQTIERDAIRVA
jgi:uncharacterized protein